MNVKKSNRKAELFKGGEKKDQFTVLKFTLLTVLCFFFCEKYICVFFFVNQNSLFCENKSMVEEILHEL